MSPDEPIPYRLTQPLAPCWVTCSWCHALCRNADRYCPSCGHRGNLPRTACDCGACRLWPLVWAAEGAQALLLRLADRGAEPGALKSACWQASVELAQGLARARGFSEADVDALAAELADTVVLREGRR